MQELRFAEIDESGHLVLVSDDGSRYAVPVDDRLRSALRPRPRAAEGDGARPAAGATPREVQALIRAGQTAEEVAESTGWELARVHRFEGPVLAEREHVVGLAQAAHVRAHGRTDGSHTLDRRVRERLQTRGVRSEDISWDAARSEHHGPWTVLVIFAAGGKERRAAWHYDVLDRSIEALDDEARWLSEDEQALPGGLAGHPLLGTSVADDEAQDLIATMRERRSRRGKRTRKTDEGVAGTVRRGTPGNSGDSEAASETAASEKAGGGEGKSRGAAEKSRGRSGAAGESGGMVDEVLPLEDFAFDPETMGDPPAAHPRGSAPESPDPVGPDSEASVEGSSEESEEQTSQEPANQEEGNREQAEQPSGRGSRRRKGARRNLRLPKLPTAVGAPEDDPADGEPEVSYARLHHDPNEVSFDEFFGTDEDELHEDELTEDDVVEDDEGALPANELAEDEPGGQVAAEVSEVEDSEVADDHEEHEDAMAADAQPSPDEAAVQDPAQAEPEGDEPATEEPTPQEPTTEVPTTEEPGASEEQATSAKGRKGRTSVPSWDDIMFGSGPKRG
ncbi:septation protein SepH [Ornithinimicrobium sp. Y1694]|uniref:septation protein SepH n=1 Tax=Ornithinimicrobium sp. Y1694 TaxID=3418590 RepID=UPI003CEA1873